MELKIASFNVKCMFYSKQWEEACRELKKINPDIVGLQEVDCNTRRSGEGNQVQILAEKLGYPYYYFAKTIDHQGGEYGHGILSRYPLAQSQTLFFEAQSGEIRNFERHEIDINGKILCFYNTHLAGIPEQYAEIQKWMDQDEYTVLTGDMNLRCERLAGWLDNSRYLDLHGGEKLDTPIVTTHNQSCIDHIIISKNLEHYWDEKANTGIIVNIAEDCSDHYMIYTKIIF